MESEYFLLTVLLGSLQGRVECVRLRQQLVRYVSIVFDGRLLVLHATFVVVLVLEGRNIDHLVHR